MASMTTVAGTKYSIPSSLFQNEAGIHRSGIEIGSFNVLLYHRALPRPEEPGRI